MDYELEPTPATHRIVVLTGAGISAESGLKTFRDSNGLWENHRVEDVASPEGFRRNPALVLDFYNQRRAQAAEVRPNAGHIALAELERHFDVRIVTQNVDDLHERAGSSKILHLHGQLSKARSSGDPKYVVDIGARPILVGHLCPRGHQMRPHIVWFGESVPAITEAERLVASADALLVVGTSLSVYPAAGLVLYAKPTADVYIVDPGNPGFVPSPRIRFIQEKASTGVPKAIAELRAAMG